MRAIRNICLPILALVLCGEAMSVPAVTWKVKKTQPDGTAVEVFLKGDERLHWMESADGYTLLYGKNKSIVYACRDKAGNLTPSDVLYGKSSYSTEEQHFITSLSKGLKYSSAQIDMEKGRWNVKAAGASRQKASVIGKKKALCILMNFSDKEMVKTKTDFNRLINEIGYSEGNAIGSVRDFYRENSYGKMDLEVTVAGPYTAKKTAAEYAYTDPVWGNLGYFEFACESMELADADVDYSEFANENGVVETVHIIYAGYGDEAIGDGLQIWAHKAQISSAITLDGAQLQIYSCSPELRDASGSELTSIGVICHELNHVFGSADYYDIDYAGTGGYYEATGKWDLMAAGSWNSEGDCPAHINMFQKMLYGWVDAVELTDPTTITNMPNSAQNPVAYVVRPHSSSNEQYVLENKQHVGFDAAVPGEGLLIYHIHDAASGGVINNKAHPQQAYVVDASVPLPIPTSVASTYGSISTSSAPFASSPERNAFAGNTVPAMFRWRDNIGVTDGVDKPLTNIAQQGGIVSFDFMGGYQGEFLPVKDMNAELLGNRVTLTWDMPEAAAENAPSSFNVYINDEIFSADVKEKTFTATLSEYGTCTFGVSAVYGGEESLKRYYVVEYADSNNPITNLTIAQEEGRVVLGWEAPVLPDGKSLSHFEIRRNGETVAEDLANMERSYTDELSKTEEYKYAVVAHYEEDQESVPVEGVISFVNPCETNAISGLVVRQEGDKVVLDWDMNTSADTRRSLIMTESFETGFNGWATYGMTADNSAWILFRGDAHGGRQVVTSLGDDEDSKLVVDKWIESPAIKSAEAYLISFWLKADSADYEVYIADAATGKQTKVFSGKAEGAGWRLQEVRADAPTAGDIRVVFRHYGTVGKGIALDDVSVYAIPRPHFNVYAGGELVGERMLGNTFEKELDKSGTYKFEVTYVDYCETDPVSASIDFVKTDIEEVSEAEISVYPNPSKGMVRIVGEQDMRIEILDVTGKVIRVIDLAKSGVVFVSDIPGVYFARIRQGEEIQVIKLIVE